MFSSRANRDLKIALVLAMIAYMVIPDILTRTETVLLLWAVTASAFVCLQDIGAEIEAVRKRREALKIRPKAEAIEARRGKVIDFPVRKPARRIPAFKVVGKDA